MFYLFIYFGLLKCFDFAQKSEQNNLVADEPLFHVFCSWFLTPAEVDKSTMFCCKTVMFSHLQAFSFFA